VYCSEHGVAEPRKPEKGLKRVWTWTPPNMMPSVAEPRKPEKGLKRDGSENLSDIILTVAEPRKPEKGLKQQGGLVVVRARELSQNPENPRRD